MSLPRTATKVAFDVLEIRVLEEMPMLLDVMASTLNKVVALLQNYALKVKERHSQAGWDISAPLLLISPFKELEIGAKKIDRITEFKNTLEISESLTFKREGKEFDVLLGYYYNVESNRKVLGSWFSFQISDWTLSKDLLPESFHDIIKKEAKPYEIVAHKVS